jgi:hypothetical protein
MEGTGRFFSYFLRKSLIIISAFFICMTGQPEITPGGYCSPNADIETLQNRKGIKERPPKAERKAAILKARFGLNPCSSGNYSSLHQECVQSAIFCH